MKYKLSELLDLFDLQEVNIAKFIMTAYNNVVPTNFVIDEAKATSISKVLKYMLNHLLNCESVFSDADKGISVIKSIITTHILSIVVEYDRVEVSLSKKLLTQHTQDKFQPIDSDEIDNSPIARDTTTFTDLDNFNAKMEMLGKSTAIDTFLQDIRSILRTMF